MSTEPAKRVLVVDDQAETAAWIADEARTLGCEVEVAHDGVTALQAVVRFRPDFLLVDIAMPGMNGWELARRVRRLEPAVQARLIAISALRQDAHLARSIAAGFEQHLVKPLRLQELATVLTSAHQFSPVFTADGRGTAPRRT